MSTKRVLIAGGAGFLGSHLCRRYLDDGWLVTCVDNYVTGRRSNIESLKEYAGFNFVEADIVAGLISTEPLDLILHMASLASPPFYKKFPIETLMVGALGTQHMLELAVENNARLVFASTSEVYGDPQENPQKESYWGHVNPIGPRSMYDESKRFGEAMVRAYVTTRGANVGIARIFNTYGPDMRFDDGRVITNFLGQIIRGQALTVHGDGSQTRSFCYVSDLVEGIVRLAASEHGGPINLGNPFNEMTIMELAQRLSVMFGQTFNPGPAMPKQDVDDPMVRCPDISLAQEVLGWEPQVSFEDGIQKTRAYLEAALSD
ncbi:MAG TPA: NAD-dependent epimerase/dehydratase family protein [Myxococcales bacterium]|nr:NAD-dependent epimerase/dehydratase family protein [Myxococcales bacterium]HIN85069.1 NAD-dependent epimerase/dehydratase family protein [Myxococcales bacterium]